MSHLIAAAVTLTGVWAPETTAASASATHLVRGPAVVRIDRRGVDSDSPESEYRYVVVFKLNRDTRRRITDDDPNRGIDGERGNYSINGFGLANETGAPGKFRDQTNCFFSYVDAPWRRLDRVRLGRRVEVRLQPLTPDSSGRPTLGKRYVVRRTLRLSDPKFRSHAARSALERIGCRD